MTMDRGKAGRARSFPAQRTLPELAVLAREGDRAAAEALCRHLKDPLFGYCMSRLRASADAEDVCQEVLVAIIAGLGRLERPEAIMGYALGVARNQVLRHLRRRPQRREVSIEGHAAETSTCPAPDEADPRDLRERMMLALSGLLAEEAPEVQELVRLYYREGRTSHEIAEALEIKPSGVRMRVKRIRERLRARLLALALEAQDR